MAKSREKYIKSDILFYSIVYGYLIIALLIVLYPVIYIISASFSNPLAVLSGKLWLFPVGFNLEGYKAVFREKEIMMGYGNSLFYTAAGTSINVFMTILAAYPLSRKDFFGRNIFMFLFVFTMIFNGGLIPTYMLVKDLGIIHTRWALLLPAAVGPWNVILTRTFFQSTIPVELLEAAKLDGCSDISFIRKVVIPLSGPIIAVISLFYGIGHWNAYFSALIYLNNRAHFPLQIILREILIQNQITSEMLSTLNAEDAAAREALSELLRYSLIVIASAPMMIIYPFVQKYFVRGVMIGALKG